MLYARAIDPQAHRRVLMSVYSSREPFSPPFKPKNQAWRDQNFIVMSSHEAKHFWGQFSQKKKVASVQSLSPLFVQVYGQLPGQCIAHRAINESPDRQVALELIKDPTGGVSF